MGEGDTAGLLSPLSRAPKLSRPPMPALADYPAGSASGENIYGSPPALWCGFLKYIPAVDPAVNRRR